VLEQAPQAPEPTPQVSDTEVETRLIASLPLEPEPQAPQVPVILSDLRIKKIYRVGEKLTYNIRWLGITVGYATLEVKGIVDIDGRKHYHLMSRARSNDFLSKIYPVEDVIESFIDAETLLSRRFKKIQREGRYRSEEEVDHDQEKHTGHYYSKKNESSKDFEILPDSQDTLSVFYYFRYLDWKIGDVKNINVVADEKKHVVHVRVLDKERLEVRNLGVHEAIVVEPILEFQGFFQRKGRIWIWFSDDEYHVPLMMETKVPIIGSINATLTKIE